jgi:hypothetical protein
MASKEYEIAFQLGAKINSSMGQAFGNAQKQLAGVNKGLRQVHQRAGMANNALNGLSRVIKVVGGAMAAYMGVQAIKSFANESVEAAKAQIEAETKLEAVLKNVHSLQAQGPEAYKKAKRELMGVASNLQKVGVIGDEVTLAGMQQLATFQLSQKEISILSGGMTDLLAQQKGLNATQEDAVNIANMIGKVMDGQVGALRRVGISFTKAQEQALKTGDRMQRAAILAEVLKSNVGGVNAELAKTDQGKIQQMNNAWGDMKEEIGKRILPLQAKFAGWVFTQIPKVQGVLLGVMDKISIGIDFIGKGFSYLTDTVFPALQPYIAKISNAFMKVYNALNPNINSLKSMSFDILPTLISAMDSISSALQRAANFYVEHKDLINALVLGIGAGIVAFRAINEVIGTTIKIVGLVGSTIKGLGSIMAFVTSPVGIVVVAIGALVTVGWLVYKNWDKIKNWFIQLWTEIKDSVASVGQFFADVFTTAYNSVTYIFSGIKDFFKGIFDGVVGIFKASINGWINIINTVIGSINKINIKIPNWVPGFGGNSIGFNIPKIPQLAEGAYVKHRPGGVLANIGEGKEDEGIFPLSRLENLLNSPAKKEQTLQIIWSPQYIIQGNADKEVLKDVAKQSRDDFERRYKDLMARRNRLSFTPGVS